MRVEDYGSQIRIWLAIEQKLNAVENETKIKYKSNYSKTELCMKNIKLCITYPRLDVNVSKHLNHLLKAPFCIHPKTGLISVPLSGKDILEFKLGNIPEIDETIEDFNKNL